MTFRRITHGPSRHGDSIMECIFGFRLAAVKLSTCIEFSKPQNAICIGTPSRIERNIQYCLSQRHMGGEPQSHGPRHTYGLVGVKGRNARSCTACPGVKSSLTVA